MNIEELMNQLQKRPGAYVGCLELEPVVHFVDGFLFSNYVAGRIDNIEKKFRDEFHDWSKKKLEEQYRVELEEHHNYLYYIMQVCHDSKDGLKILFELSNAFFEQCHKDTGNGSGKIITVEIKDM